MKNSEKILKNFRASLESRFPGTTSSLIVLDGDSLMGNLERQCIIATIMPIGEMEAGKSCAVYEYFLPHKYATAEDIHMVEDKLARMWEIARR